MFAEQNAFFLNDNGVWRDVTSGQYPATVDFSHGSTIADLNGDGDKEIIVNNLGNFDEFPSRYILDYQGGRLVLVRNANIENAISTFSMSADFNQDGSDDVVLGSQVFMGGPTFGQTSLTLPQTQYESIGFSNWHGGTTGNFNGDGFPDLLKVSASNGDSRTGVGNWHGLRLGLFIFNGQGFDDRSSGIASYDMNQFGNNMRALDVDFDGHLDIVPNGSRYFFGGPIPTNSNANFILRNDGTGRFEVLALNVEKPGFRMHFLQQSEFDYSAVTIHGYTQSLSIAGSAQSIKPTNVQTAVGTFGAGASSIGGFDSHYYLHQYPEVSALITAGTYQSAHDHYVRAGASQGKLAFAPGTWVWGTSGDNVIVLREGNDTITGGAGNDVIDGGEGRDTAVYSGTRANFTIAANAAGHTVTSVTAGNDALISIERLQFSDKQVALDLSAGQSAGNTARLLGAAFGAASVHNAEYAGIGIDAFDSGTTMSQLSDVVANMLALDNNNFVSLLYRNLTRTEISNAELVEFTKLLQGSGGSYSQGQLLEIAANMDLHVTNIDLIGLQQSGLVFV